MKTLLLVKNAPRGSSLPIYFFSKEEIANKRNCDDDEGDLSPRCVKRMKLGHTQAV